MYDEGDADDSQTERQRTQEKDLVQLRKVAKMSLTKIKTYVTSFNADSTDVSGITIRDRRIREVWQKYDKVQSQLEVFDFEKHNPDRDIVEKTYDDVQTEIERILQLHRTRIGQPSPTVTMQPQVNMQSPSLKVEDISKVIAAAMSQQALPSLNIKPFSGNYEEYRSFMDLFDSMIHQNDNMPDIQKFYHLKAVLIGDAAKLIENLSMTSENYAVARRSLKERYDNEQFILNAHFKILFDCASVQRDSVDDLRKLHSCMKQELQAIKNLGIKTDDWDQMVIYIMKQKLDVTTRKQWELSQKDPKKFPTLQDFYGFLEQRCLAFEAAQTSQQEKMNKRMTITQTSKSHVVSENKTNHECQLCKANHHLFYCNVFKAKQPSERVNTVKEIGVCFNCLRPGHSARNCNASKCKKCDRMHNTMLHVESQASTQSVATGNREREDPRQSHENTQQASREPLQRMTFTNSSHNDFYTLLPTAEVVVKNNRLKTRMVAKTLLDSGSQSNFVTESLIKLLKIETTPVNIQVSGITNSISQITRKADITLMSKDMKFCTSITCLVINKITDPLPGKSISKDELKIPPELELADSTFHKRSNIDILIGSDTFWSLLRYKKLQLNQKQLFLHDTRLGYIVAGRTSHQSIVTHSSCNTSTLKIQQELRDQIEEFWKTEELHRKQRFTVEEEDCERHFKETHSRTSDGRFKVRLPLKADKSTLGESIQGATDRLKSTERKMEKNPEFGKQYRNFMEDYLALNHMTEITETNGGETSYILPHHAVLKDDSTTSKLRVVFDASYKTTTGRSLNDLLMVGPKIQNDAWEICLRFRRHQYVMSADISKMYRQILVDETDRVLQQILWRNKPTEPIKTYTLNTVTYGMASSPFIAIRCLKQLAEENAITYPEASQIISTDFYVDDLLTGGDTIEFVQRMKNNITSILQSAGCELHKWKSNCPSLLQEKDLKLDTTKEPSLTLPQEHSTTPKTLGLVWNQTEDTISYHVKTALHPGITKRQILSNIARLYDPLGLIAPLIITAKMIMQMLWQTNIDWDDIIPDAILEIWTSFQEDLNNLIYLTIPRPTFLPDPILIELHAFSDASIKAFGAVVYIKTVDQDGKYKCTVICSKSRVAPLKTLTLPRLELCGAVLAAQLCQKVQEAFRIPAHDCHYWTDSTIVLYWIQAEPTKHHTFIANRISEIQQLTNLNQWHHVSSKENPADLVSRGSTVMNLIDSTLWWNGPGFLSHAAQNWPTNPCFHNSDDTLLEVKKNTATTHLITIQSDVSEVLSRFSSWIRLIRVITYCRRFYKKLKHLPSSIGPLSTDEINETSRKIILLVQEESFVNDIKNLKSCGTVNKKSKLLPLHPFLQDGLVRVGGRLTNSTLPADHKHPLLLPANHKITKLIFEHLHKKHLHCGPEQLLALIRQKYWPISGRRLAKETTSKCTRCFTYNPTNTRYLMGNLPTDRIEPSLRPFITTGVDYAGPIYILERRSRGKPLQTKAYIAVFVCFNTKATHLELVTSLSTERFLAALKRFIARRGIPKRIYSDNGTNFVGANRELTDVYTFLKNQNSDIFEECSNLNIEWKFQPPHAPNFGGLWESTVKSFKRHFRKITRDHALTYEECYTLITQIESILNSRPLCPLSSDPHDNLTLTPAHFLIGDTLVEPPEHNYAEFTSNRLSHHQQLQKMRHHFWNRWRTEYLHTLQTRTKWQHHGCPMQLNDLVLLIDDNAPPLHWPRGRIIDVHPGSDGVIRVVTVKTVKGIFKRPVTKVCVLPNGN